MLMMLMEMFSPFFMSQVFVLSFLLHSHFLAFIDCSLLNAVDEVLHSLIETSPIIEIDNLKTRNDDESSWIETTKSIQM